MEEVLGEDYYGILLLSIREDVCTEGDQAEVSGAGRPSGRASDG